MRIAFTSCFSTRGTGHQAVWDHIAEKTPDALVLLGDSVYADVPGQVVGQCGSSKPDARTPLPGLYIVGCDAGGRGAGTHQAVDSGFNVAALVEQDLA